MNDDATLTGLGNTYRQAISQIEDAQSSANITIDRSNEAVRLVGMAADGSTSDLVGNALAATAAATLAVESAIAQLVQAKTDIEQHLSAKGI